MVAVRGDEDGVLVDGDDSEDDSKPHTSDQIFYVSPSRSLPAPISLFDAVWYNPNLTPHLLPPP